jgi:AraC family ethanolamine operon transcriptional activator
LSGGTFHGVLNEVWFDNVQIFRERTNQVVYETGRAWDGSRTMGIPVAMEGEGIFCGSRFNLDSIVTIGDGDLFDLRTPKSLDLLGVTIDADDLSEFAAQVWKTDTEEKLDGKDVLTPSAETGRGLCDFLLEMLANIHAAPQILNYAQIRRSMGQEIYNNLVGVICGTDALKAEPPAAASRKAVVASAKEYVLNNPEEPITVADLCKALGISRRTLQYAFQSVLDINPVAYLRAVRLNSVRRMLKRADAGASVADIAARWGFWHLSRFAADYKLLFGELPSQTLRQRGMPA